VLGTGTEMHWVAAVGQIRRQVVLLVHIRNMMVVVGVESYWFSLFIVL